MQRRSTFFEPLNIVVIMKVRSFGRVINAFLGFSYDFRRYFLFSAWRADMSNKSVRDYHLVKVYHSLEKSLSYQNRKKSSGWDAAHQVLELVKYSSKEGNYGFHDEAAVGVLKSFIEHPDNELTDSAANIKKELEGLAISVENIYGAMGYSDTDFLRGRLSDPESFFLSRYSLREFSPQKVSELELKRVLRLAMKAPSVCNRQAWHVYHSTDDDIIRKALSYQQGNRGFGHKVPNLMIITTDLSAFMPGQEHYQHWIDGGLFSMSLIHALHSLGVASCCLNWSQSPSNDLKMRKALNVKHNHTVMMMLAFGYPENNSRVCISARRPVEEICTELKEIINEGI